VHTRCAMLTCILSFGLALGFPAGAAAAEDGRPTVAIVGFDAAPGGWVLPPPQLGMTLADLMMDRLVSANAFHVLDGQWLSRTRAIDQLRASARAAGVDYLVLGSITRFSTDTGQRTIGGGGFRLPILGAFHRRKTQMVVSIVARVVDVRTGEIVASSTGEGIASRKNVGLGGLGFGGVPGALAVANAAVQSRDALLDEAVQRCVASAARGLLAAAPRLAHGE